jgi:hypothetical protein
MLASERNARQSHWRAFRPLTAKRVPSAWSNLTLRQPLPERVPLPGPRRRLPHPASPPVVAVTAVTITQSAVRLTGPRSPARPRLLSTPAASIPCRCLRPAAAAAEVVEAAVTTAMTAAVTAALIATVTAAVTAVIVAALTIAAALDAAIKPAVTAAVTDAVIIAANLAAARAQTAAVTAVTAVMPAAKPHLCGHWDGGRWPAVTAVNTGAAMTTTDAAAAAEVERR